MGRRVVIHAVFFKCDGFAVGPIYDAVPFGNVVTPFDFLIDRGRGVFIDDVCCTAVDLFLRGKSNCSMGKS